MFELATMVTPKPLPIVASEEYARISEYTKMDEQHILKPGIRIEK